MLKPQTFLYLFGISLYQPNQAQNSDLQSQDLCFVLL